MFIGYVFIYFLMLYLSFLFHIISSDEDSNILNIICKQYIEMLDHNVLEPYKFINVCIYMLILSAFYI